MQYTQQEISNFNLIKGALLSRRGIYYDKDKITDLLTQTPRVCLMQYTDEGDKYILFGLLRTSDWQHYADYVLGRKLIKVDSNISLQLVQLRACTGAISIFDYGIGNKYKPQFDYDILNLSLEDENQFEDNELEIYREAFIDALTLDMENDIEDQTPLVRFIRNMTFYIRSYWGVFGIEELKHLEIVMEAFHAFLERNDSDIIKRLQRRQGTGPNTTIYNMVTNLEKLKNVIAARTSRQIDSFDSIYILDGLEELTDLSLEIIEEKTGSGIPQFYDTLVEGNDVRVVALGSEYSMDQFKRLGKFFIEKKLVYDDFDNNEIDAGCSLADLMTNIAYPVLVNPGTFEQVYCIQDIIGWINTGKTTDPNTRQEITKIRVMNEQDIEKKELQNITKEKNQIEDKINQLRSEPGNMREIRKLEYKKRLLDESIRQQKEKKIDRKTRRLPRKLKKRKRLKF